MKSSIFLKALPYFVSIVLFYVATVVFFLPEFNQNRVLRQDDIDKYYGMTKELTDHQEATGEYSMWAGNMFGGMPVYLFSPYFPDFPVSAIDQALTGFLPRGTKASYILFLAMVCPFIMLLSFRVHPYLACAGGIAFALSTYNLILIDVGHITKIWAISYAALILAGMRLTFSGKRLLGFALTALGMTLEMRAFHPQITYYLAFVCFAYVISEAVLAFKKKDLQPTLISGGVLILAVVLGIGVSAGKLMTTLEYAPYSTRGDSELTPMDQSRGQGEQGLDKDYAFSWSQGKMETLTLLIPNLYGSSSSEKLDPKSDAYQLLKRASRTGQIPPDFFDYATKSARLYWGDQPFTSGPIYAGATICFLFVLGMFLIEKRTKNWLLAGVIITIFIAWGHNMAFFNYFMFDYFPGFNKFRTVSMALSITVLLMTLGGILAIQEVFRQKFSQELLKKLAISVGIVGGVCLVVVLMAGSINTSVPSDQQVGMVGQIWQSARQDMMRSDALRSLIFILLVAGTIYYTLKEKITKTVGMLIIGVLIVGDLWGVGKRYLNADSFERQAAAKPYVKAASDELILKDAELGYRVLTLGNPFQETQTGYFHRSVGGYFAVKMRRYQDLIERRLGGEEKALIEGLKKGNSDFSSFNAINMLNTKYIKFGDTEREVLPNPSAFGAVWFASEIKAVQTADDEMKGISESNLQSVAIVNTSKFPLDKTTFVKDSTQEIKLVDYTPNYLKYESQSTEDAFAVFSEIYYPEGWVASIDGKEVAHINVNYILRGMQVPAGKHTIEFRFDPQTYKTGATITQISAYLVGLIIFLALVLSLYREVKS
jgi:hypothetical protein